MSKHKFLFKHSSLYLESLNSQPESGQIVAPAVEEICQDLIDNENFSPSPTADLQPLQPYHTSPWNLEPDYNLNASSETFNPSSNYQYPVDLITDPTSHTELIQSTVGFELSESVRYDDDIPCNYVQALATPEDLHGSYVEAISIHEGPEPQGSVPVQVNEIPTSISDGTSWNQTSVIRKNQVAVIAKAPSRASKFLDTGSAVGTSGNADTSKDETATTVTHPTNPNIICHETDPVVYECKVCEKKFKSKNNIKYHEHNSSGTKFTYTCEICGKGMFASTHYRYHMLSHSGERPYKCSVCPKAFLTESKLKRHQVIHKEEKVFECRLCPRKFSSGQKLESHVVKHSVPPNCCRHCGKGFDTEGELKTHMSSTHAERSKFFCPNPKCGKGFKRKKHLDSHVSVHTEEKPFACQRCGKCFRTELSHSHHMKTHLDERPFSCSICGRGFVLEKDCSRHEKIHQDKSPYSCPSCDKTFRRLDNRNRHVRIYHLEEKDGPVGMIQNPCERPN